MFIKEKKKKISITIHNISYLFYSSIYYFFPCLFFVGTSDPYVKFKVAGKEVFRSRTIHKNLNPVWDEKASLLVETLRDPLYVKVFMHPHREHDLV